MLPHINRPNFIGVVGCAYALLAYGAKESSNMSEILIS